MISRLSINTTQWVNAQTKLNQGHMNLIEGNLKNITNKVNEIINYLNEGEGDLIVIDDAMSPTSTNPVQNRVIYQALEGVSDMTVSSTESSAPGAGTAMSIQLDGDWYNFRDGRLVPLLTEGYVCHTTLSDGDTVSDSGLIAAYEAHLPITVNGMLLNYHATDGDKIIYGAIVVSGGSAQATAFEFDTTDDSVGIYVTSGGGGSAPSVSNHVLMF